MVTFLCINSGGKVIFVGNGGSFADDKHLIAKFIYKLFTKRNPLPSMTLGRN